MSKHKTLSYIVEGVGGWYIKDIEKVDYINLLVSQLNESLSSELKYCISKE